MELPVPHKRRAELKGRNWKFRLQLPIAQPHRPELDLVAVAQLQAILGDLALVDVGAAGAAGVVNAVLVAFQAQDGMVAGDGDVVTEGDLRLGRRAADAHLGIAQRQLFGHQRLGIDHFQMGHDEGWLIATGPHEIDRGAALVQRLRRGRLAGRGARPAAARPARGGRGRAGAATPQPIAGNAQPRQRQQPQQPRPVEVQTRRLQLFRNRRFGPLGHGDDNRRAGRDKPLDIPSHNFQPIIAEGEIGDDGRERGQLIDRNVGHLLAVDQQFGRGHLALFAVEPGNGGGQLQFDRLIQIGQGQAAALAGEVDDHVGRGGGDDDLRRGPHVAVVEQTHLDLGRAAGGFGHGVADPRMLAKAGDARPDRGHAGRIGQFGGHAARAGGEVTQIGTAQFQPRAETGIFQVQGVDGHASLRRPRGHVARLGLRRAGVGAVADEDDGRGHGRVGLHTFDLADQTDDAVVERGGPLFGRQLRRIEQVGDAVEEGGRGQELLRPVGANLVDGHVVDLLLHIAGRGVLLDGSDDGRYLLARAAGGVDQKDGQRAHGGFAVKDDLIDREAVVAGEQRFGGEIERRALAVHTVDLEPDAGESIGVGVSDVEAADLARLLRPDHDYHAKNQAERGQQTPQDTTVGVSHETYSLPSKLC
ncbi:protein of unknown function [Candidatus Promineifilum breve]|uniref:Uncharacterized protein n=1 Tax=Candidatus Promineifilum breve TaxID=1806508 RepID=A0A160T480_9CHLR|nr:protein of unknown function [Candidatus Promineifilum breve]